MRDDSLSGLTRRDFVRICAGLGISAATAACGGGSSWQSAPPTRMFAQRSQPASSTLSDPPLSFVQRVGNRFTLDGKPFHFSGANAQQAFANGDLVALQSAFESASRMGLRVLRVWGASEIGARDGSVATLGSNPDWRPYYQYWDGATGRPAANDAPNGLQFLDSAVVLARQYGIRLIVILVDNWDWYWGGVNQYLTWFGGSAHGTFFTDVSARQAYKDWIAQLLNRINSATGIRYIDEPVIMAWELANEASCYGGQNFPAGGCVRADIEAWIAEMSAYIKAIDPNHLVGVGDQGHFAARDDVAMGWPYRSTNEPDFETVLKISSIDFGTYHIYPHDFQDGDGSLSPVDYGLRYIRDHERIARSIRKPAIFEEFGARDASVQVDAFDAWLGALYEEAGAGFMFYELGARFADGRPVWDTGGYSIFPESSAASVLTTWAQRFDGLAEALATEQKIASLYIAFFFRAADFDGMEFWRTVAQNSGLNDLALMRLMAGGFANHPSFAAIYGALSDEAYVDAIYVNIGGKLADAAGKAYWLGQIAGGLSRSAFVADFVFGLLEITEQTMQELVDAGAITEAERQDALARKYRMTNKAEMAIAFLKALGAATNLLPSTDPLNPASLAADPSYRAAQNILRDVTENPATMTDPLAYLAGNPTIDGINSIFGP